MKKTTLAILFSLVLVLVFILPGFADEEGTEEMLKIAEKTVSICPKTKMKDGCMTCHSIPDWTLKEKKPNANRSLPGYPIIGIEDEGKTAAMLITDITSAEAERFFDYVRWHPEIDKCIFEIHSPGGSLFEAWRIVGMMELWKSKGMIIETRCYGFAASAGFIIFVNGTPEHRFASATSELMWHELYTFAMFKVSRPSDTMDEAIVLRHLQDTASNFLAERSKLNAKEWDKKVHKKEFWCNGQQAIKFGLSDGYPK